LKEDGGDCTFLRVVGYLIVARIAVGILSYPEVVGAILCVAVAVLVGYVTFSLLRWAWRHKKLPVVGAVAASALIGWVTIPMVVVLTQNIELPDVRQATTVADSADETLHVAACANLHAMIADGPWEETGQNNRVLMAPPDYQRQVIAEADRWGCSYD